MERKQTIKYLICDTLAAMLAWAALYVFRKYAIEPPFDGFRSLGGILSTAVADYKFWMGLVLVPAGWLILFTIQGTYTDVLRKARVKELLDTALGTLIGVVVVFFVLLVDDNILNYRSHYRSFLFLLGVHFVLTYSMRLVITSQTVRRVHSRQVGFPTLMVGCGKKAFQTYLDLENQETYSGEQFVGFLRVGEGTAEVECELSKVMPSLGTLAELREMVQKHNIQEAIVAVEDDQREMIKDILRLLACSGDIIIKITPDVRDLIVGSVKQSSIFHSPLITINTRLMEEWQYAVKRMADVVLSVIAMLVLSPVYLVTAIIVKTTSPGPVFYAQERVGYHGRPFRMHKFRSMYVNAEDAGPALSKDDDPRITPFGRFMRKVRLDEIPQFWNVLRGTMSIVGPRPERQFYIDQIVRRAPEYLLLQRIKPGITSWGQVKYGYASNVDEMVERLRYDLLYLDNMSLTTDLKIMVYTVKIIVQGRGK